jgi:hypothetical protein
MEILAKNGSLFGVLAVVFGLMGCAGNGQVPPAPFGMGPQTHRIANFHSRINPMRTDDLLYVAEKDIGAVYIYSWPQGKLVSEITGLLQPEGICADKAQNVYVVDSKATEIYEFTPDGSGPIKTWVDPSGYPWACAIDPATGTLAVSNAYDFGGSKSNAGGLLFWIDGSGTPVEYKYIGVSGLYWMGYDTSSRLLLEGTGVGSPPYFFLGEVLSQKPSELYELYFPPSVPFKCESGIQWDGKYMTVGGCSAIYQVTVSRGRYPKLEIVGTTNLSGVGSYSSDYYIPHHNSQGSKAVVTYTALGSVYQCPTAYFLYPAGGAATKLIPNYCDADPEGVVVVKAERSEGLAPPPKRPATARSSLPLVPMTGQTRSIKTESFK